VFRHPVVFECEDDPDHNGDELDDQDIVSCGRGPLAIIIIPFR
jgi:hypothetical protein